MRLLKPNEKVTLLSEGRIYIDNGTHVKIYEKGFCIENFYNPTVRGHPYTSAFICKNESPSNNFYGRTLPEIWPLLQLERERFKSVSRLRLVYFYLYFRTDVVKS